MDPLTDAEVDELRDEIAEAKEPAYEGHREVSGRALEQIGRLLDELQERRGRDTDHVAVMDIAHDYATVMRDWNARARAVLAELPPVGRGDQVTVPRELYERLLALK